MALEELSLHLLDIAENSVAAGAHAVEIIVEEDSAHDSLTLSVRDDGVGMDLSKLERLGDAFITSRTTRKAGFGIAFLKAAAEACDGRLWASSTPGRGTCLTAEFRRSHIDRMPLGDLAGTALALVVSVPHVRWLLKYRVDDRWFEFDTEPIRRELGDIPMTEPHVLRFIKEMLEDGIHGVRSPASTPA